jgi:hypothetical protein
MAFQICKLVDGRSMWLKRASPMVTWGPQNKATLFATKGEARRAANALPTREGPVGIVEGDAQSDQIDPSERPG